jgi:uncharacterized protein (TIGR03437 family)
MHRFLTALLLCAAAQAATLQVSISASATIPLSGLSGASFSGTGTGTLTGGISDTGTFNASVSLGSTGSNYTGPYSLAMKNGTIGGTLTVPVAVLTGSGSGTMSVTSATGSYAGDSGTFNVTGTGAIGASGISLSFTGSGTITTGGTVTAPPPTISAVEDAGSYTPNIAPGSIFVVKGTNMSASGLTELPFPLPQSAGGTSITFTPAAGGTGTQAYLIYTYNESGVNQLAAVLPSTVTPGTYNVTVAYNGTTSSQFTATVAAVKFGIITQDSTGSGMASAQIVPSYALDRLTTGQVAGYQYGIEPAHPGDSLVIYGTGMGAVTGGDNIASAGYNFVANGVNVQVVLGGTTIAAAYAGRTAGASGLDQVNFTIPSNFSATGCAVPIQVVVGSTTSMAATLSIAPSASATACVYPGLTLAQLQALDQGGTYTTGGFDVEQISETVASLGAIKEALASGEFSQVTGFELGAASSSATVTSSTIGACTVTTVTSGGSTAVSAGGVVTYLDAGAVTLTSPGGTSTLTETINVYSLTIGQSGLAAGTYTLNGAGGKDVGKFGPVSITLGSPLTITGGLPTTVTEAAGMTLNWTGGNASDIVEIIGGASTSTGTAPNTVTTTTGFYCLTTAGPGTFTVPASVLTQLPKVTLASDAGSLEIFSTPTPASFTAPLTAGGSVTANFSALVGVGGLVAYQ